jgi:AMP phosphorylase
MKDIAGEKLKAGIIDIDAGRPIVLLHELDAQRMSIHMGDRVVVCKDKKNSCERVAIVDVSDTMVREGQVGIFNDLAAPMKLRPNSKVILSPRPKPESVGLIRKKIEGQELTEYALNRIVSDIVADKLSDIELTSFVTASAIHGFTKRETVALTNSMVDTGDKLDFEGTVVDKHCIGGVPGNRTTMVVVPILAQLGLKVPKTSSRAITSPSGTADTMEVLANVSYGAKDIKRFVNTAGACIVWGGAVNLAPADDKIIRIEYPLSIDAEGQVLASIMSKKKSVGSDYVILDIPYGKGSKVEDKKKAMKLGKKFIWLGKEVGMKIHVVYTDGTQPIGRGVGPVLEAKDVLMTLRGDGSKDLAKKSVMMAGELMNFCGVSSKNKALSEARECLESGDAETKLREIIGMQNGDPGVKPEDLSPGRFKKEIKADSSGKVKSIDNLIIAQVARLSGAPKDPGAGIWLEKKVGDRVEAGERLFTLYAENKTKLNFALKVSKETNPYIFS